MNPNQTSATPFLVHQAGHAVVHHGEHQRGKEAVHAEMHVADSVVREVGNFLVATQRLKRTLKARKRVDHGAHHRKAQSRAGFK